MLWTIAVLLVILWILGLTLRIAGGLIHLLLLVAIAVVLIRIIKGRKPL